MEVRFLPRGHDNKVIHSLIDKTVSKKIKTVYTNHKGRFDFYIHACHVKISSSRYTVWCVPWSYQKVRDEVSIFLREGVSIMAKKVVRKAKKRAAPKKRKAAPARKRRPVAKKKKVAARRKR